ncbi:MAG: ankyrin repeat domain-containing protein [Gammaproteobacteria bacterium]|nr:ankyrin repeat domain-containing protein [Gammaproteobacteria bacterium]
MRATRERRAAIAKFTCVALLTTCAFDSRAQIAPSARQIAGYTGLLAAAAQGDAARIQELVKSEPPDVRDAYDRTPLHVAAYAGHHDVMRALVAAGADPNALEHDRYDIVTIAAVADDLPTLKLALSLGASAGNITSRYDGTALIAAAHLGHVEVVETLLRAGAPLDHVNNLGWTAVIEAIVLGDGGERHTQTLRLLLAAGADANIADRNGKTPLALARSRGYVAMQRELEAVGAH